MSGSGASDWRRRLGSVGVWRSGPALDAALARDIERLGYGTVWIGGSPSSNLGLAEALLDATDRLQVATGIVNIWHSDGAELARSYHRIEERHPGRLLLGIGSGHREATPERVRPVDAMVRYLDLLDEGGVPASARLLSALGPRMLELARERSAGTHPYLTIPSQTAEEREALGRDALVAPEQTVVLDPEPSSARRSARAFLQRYLGMENYTRTMRRGGFTEADVSGEGSDELVDRIVVHGDAAALAGAVSAHLDAGADHVCVQVQPPAAVLPTLEALAAELGLA